MFASYQQSFPNVPEEFWSNVLKEINPEALITLIIPIYDKYYTTTEINKMIEFYQTPLGKKVISTIPQIMPGVNARWLIQGKKIAEKVYNNMKKKGYVKDNNKYIR